MLARAAPLALLSWALLGCKPDPQVEAKNRQDFERVAQQIAKLAAGVPAPEALAEDQPCNDSELETNYKSKQPRLSLTGVDFELLLRVGASTPQLASDPWSFLSSPGLAEHLSKGGSAAGAALGSAADALREVEQRRYVVVFRSAQRELPKVDGDKFDGGMFDGHLIVMDLDTAKVACHALLEVESSDVVEFEQRGISGKHGDRALIDDFQKQFEKVGSKALRSVSKRARVPLAGITLE
jgi:hypothetical protein